MTTEQQRLHEQHKARLARIQNNAFQSPEPPKPVSSPVDKFNWRSSGFPRVGNLAGGVGRETVATNGENSHAAGVINSSRVAPVVQSEYAAPATRTGKSATASSTASSRPKRVFESAASSSGAHLTVRDIQDAVIAYFRMSRLELFAKRRSKATVRRRHIAIYLSKILTIQSLPEIGMRFGGLDHTTILYASRKIERELPCDAALARDVAEIERMLAELNEARANEATDKVNAL